MLRFVFMFASVASLALLVTIREWSRESSPIELPGVAKATGALRIELIRGEIAGDARSASARGVGMRWTTARRPALQGPVQGDWFTDMSDANDWADQVEPIRHIDLGLFIYDRGPVVSVAGPAQPAMVFSIRHGIRIPDSRLGFILSILPAAFVASAVVRFRRARIRSARLRGGCCIACGYDLRASGERCPECGAARPSIA